MVAPGMGRSDRIGWAAFALVWLLAGSGRSDAQQVPGKSVPLTADALLLMTSEQLDQLYLASPPASVPCGKVRGRAVVAPGAKLGPAMSRAAHVMWQGKVFQSGECTAINKFFGVRIIKGQLYYAPSWMDGRTSLILDYENTSLLYADYRDEIRQVAPGLLLGAMYDRTTCPPKFKMYFLLEPCR